MKLVRCVKSNTCPKKNQCGHGVPHKKNSWGGDKLNCANIGKWTCNLLLFEGEIKTQCKEVKC